MATVNGYLRLTGKLGFVDSVREPLDPGWQRLLDRLGAIPED